MLVDTIKRTLRVNWTQLEQSFNKEIDQCIARGRLRGQTLRPSDQKTREFLMRTTTYDQLLADGKITMKPSLEFLESHWGCPHGYWSGQNASLAGSGFMALCPSATKTGDLIVASTGMQTPFVLEGRGDQYELLGPCYGTFISSLKGSNC